MTEFICRVVDRPVLAIFFTVLITIVFGLQLDRLSIDSSSDSLMVAGDPEKIFYDNVKQKFGDDVMFSVVLSADDIFKPDILQAIIRITHFLQDMDGVTRVDSLATVKKIKGEDGFLDTDDLMGYLPEDGEELNRQKKK